MKKIENHNERNKLSSDILNSIKEMAKLADIEASKSIAQEFPFDKELSNEDKETIEIIKDTQNPQVSYKLFYAI